MNTWLWVGLGEALLEFAHNENLAQERNAEREFLCSVETKKCLEARGVQLKCFDEQTLLT
jgi:hypothetical protein